MGLGVPKQVQQGAGLQPLPGFTEKNSADAAVEQVELIPGSARHPDKVRNPKVLQMQAANKMAKISVDNIIGQIRAQVDRITAIKASHAPDIRVRAYARLYRCTARGKPPSFPWPFI